jgi:hypothetical protein
MERTPAVGAAIAAAQLSARCGDPSTPEGGTADRRALE